MVSVEIHLCLADHAFVLAQCSVVLRQPRQNSSQVRVVFGSVSAENDYVIQYTRTARQPFQYFFNDLGEG
jgi:hypothetical protein